VFIDLNDFPGFEMNDKTNPNNESEYDTDIENVMITDLVCIEGAHSNHVEDQIEDHEVLGSIS